VSSEADIVFSDQGNIEYHDTARLSSLVNVERQVTTAPSEMCPE
jgi:hypothetical protein